MTNKNKYLPYLYCSPFLISFVIFQLYPAFYTLYLSMNRFDGDSDPIWVGIENYINLLHDKFFFTSISNTWIIWLFNFLPQIGIALLLSSMFTYSRIKGSNFFKAVFYFPNLIAAASISLLFYTLLDTNHGAINQMLTSTGIIEDNVPWVENPLGARGVISFIQWWMWFGNSTIICFAGMTAIPKDYYEASKVEGCTAWQTFIHVTIPLLKPTILYILVTSLIGGMQTFDVPYLLVKAGPDNSTLTMVMHMYSQGFEYYHFGYSAAISWGIFIIIGVFTILLFKAVKPNYSNI